MHFRSILFTVRRDFANSGAQTELQPDSFVDLRLDQIVDAALEGREEYDLRAFFHAPLGDADEIAYRHGVLRDLEETPLRLLIETFAKEMREVRAQIAQSRKLYYEYPKAIWFVGAARLYCRAVTNLTDGMHAHRPSSEGLRGLSEYLASYVASDAFAALVRETRSVQEDLSEVRYRLHVETSRVTVTKEDEEVTDYSDEITATFEKFRQGAAKDYRVAFSSHPEMSHLEASILDAVRKLIPEVFASLRSYVERRPDFVDAVIARFDREVQFYLGYLALIDPLRAAGLPFCFPTVSRASKDVYAREMFDLALAHKLNLEGRSPVRNDFRLEGDERALVVTGPNQGGKTTFARAFGQLHHLARLGLPVPGEAARLFLCDQLFTHFEREEQLADLQGRLLDELVRFHEILELATADSIIVMNESFASTTLEDALFIGRQVLSEILERDILCVYVTFLDELSALSDATVSMVSEVEPSDPATRTYKISRRPANGLAYALAIAEKHGLTYAMLRRRVAR